MSCKNTLKLVKTQNIFLLGWEGYPRQSAFYGCVGHISLDKGRFERWGYPGQSVFYGPTGHISLDWGGDKL